MRIIPLPSIGHAHADAAVRRILVERPPDCPIRTDDLNWALSGLHVLADPETGEVPADAEPVLAPADDGSMLRHYGVDPASSARTWRTVTPAALPVPRLRGRTKGGERLENELQAAHAVAQALRHAGVATCAETIRVQREPFLATGSRAEAFAAGTRFPPSRLWHVEITFRESVAGPLVIGDGRYCGLGIMTPRGSRRRDAIILPIRPDHRPAVAHRGALIAALRRALMSRAADDQGFIATLFSGHGAGKGPARSGQHRHVYLFADDGDGDGLIDRLGVVSPWRVDRSWDPQPALRAHFEKVAGKLRVLRAGAAGVLVLEPALEVDGSDALFARAKSWQSRTPYRLTRHPPRTDDLAAALEHDLRQECLRPALPTPEVSVTAVERGPRQGVRAKASLRFSVAVAGPIMLGRDAHSGGGLFAAATEVA